MLGSADWVASCDCKVKCVLTTMIIIESNGIPICDLFRKAPV
jgi:hypothetical protein